METDYDLIIIGAGPAGLTAGIYAGRYGLKVAIFDKLTAGGQLALAPLIENYPGYKTIAGPDLAELMKTHAEAAGAELFELTDVQVIQKMSNMFKVLTNNGQEFTAKAIILATGSTPRKLGVPGEEQFTGRGVSYCALCDAPFFSNKTATVIGGGNTAVVSAKYLSDLGSNVRLVHRRSTTRGEETIKKELLAQNVQFYWNSIVKEIRGKDKVTSIVLQTQGKELEIATDGVFIHVGETPVNNLAKKLGLKLNSEGFILVNHHQETSIEGIFAAGDITGGILQVSTAVGEATIAAINAYLYIKGGWYPETGTE